VRPGSAELARLQGAAGLVVGLARATGRYGPADAGGRPGAELLARARHRALGELEELVVVEARQQRDEVRALGRHQPADRPPAPRARGSAAPHSRPTGPTGAGGGGPGRRPPPPRPNGSSRRASSTPSSSPAIAADSTSPARRRSVESATRRRRSSSATTVTAW